MGNVIAFSYHMFEIFCIIQNQGGVHTESRKNQDHAIYLNMKHFVQSYVECLALEGVIKLHLNFWYIPKVLI